MGEENTNKDVSYYIGGTKIEVYIKFAAIAEAASMIGGKYELERYILAEIIAELDTARRNKDLCNKYGHHDDMLDAARYAFEIMAKETMKNIKEENKMAKTQNEIEFENFAKERQAQAEASLQAYKTKVENKIEAKRLECLEADKKDQAYQVANRYRYFYDGLIAAGFDENQAMAILLEKCEVTRFDVKG